MEISKGNKYFDIEVPIEWALNYAEGLGREELIDSSNEGIVKLHFLTIPDANNTIITNGCHFGINIK